MISRIARLFCAGILILAGCARREAPVDAAVRAQTLLLGNGAEPEDLDPHIVTAYTDQNILLALFEGLTAIDEKTSKAIPAAAESWETSANGLVWTFHLRAGLHWSNGEPLEAEDFIQSWQRALSPAIACEFADLLYPIRNAEKFNQGAVSDPGVLGMTAPDARTVRIELERPTPYMAALVAQPSWFPINPRALAPFGAMTKRDTPWARPDSLVGNGPFTLEEWTPNSRIVVSKNLNYWDAATVTLHQIVFFPNEDPDTEEKDFRAGQLHVTYALPVAKIDGYRHGSPELLRIDPFLQTFFLRFNVRRPPFDDPRVRRALSLAIDRNLISRRVLYSAYPAAHTFTPPNCGGYTSRARVELDIGAAQRLLAEAGHPGGQGVAPFEVQMRNDGVQPPVMEAIQAMWERELGIHATLATLEQKTWLQNQETLDYSVSTSGWAGDFVDPVTFLGLFVTGGGKNWTGWGDPGYDRMLAEAANEADPGARLEIFQRAESLLLGQGPVSPLYFGAHSYLIHPSVRGWAPALLGYHRYALVRLEE